MTGIYAQQPPQRPQRAPQSPPQQRPPQPHQPPHQDPQRLQKQRPPLLTTIISRRSRLNRYILVVILLVFAGTANWFSLEALLVPLTVLAILILILTEILRRRRRLTVRLNTVTFQTGILGKNIKSLDMEDINHVTVTQNVWQRMWNYGTLYVNMSEDEEGENKFKGLAKPEEVKTIIENIMKKRLYYKTVGHPQQPSGEV